MISYWRSHFLASLAALLLLICSFSFVIWHLLPRPLDAARFERLEKSLQPPPKELYSIEQQKKQVEKWLLHTKSEWHLKASTSTVSANYTKQEGFTVSEALTDCVVFGEGIRISAEQAQYLQNSQEVIFEGGVSLTYKTVEALCDSIHAKLPLEITLNGPLQITMEGSHKATLTASSARILLGPTHTIDKIFITGPIVCQDISNGRSAYATSAECEWATRRLILRGSSSAPVRFIDEKEKRQLQTEELVICKNPDGTESVQARGLVRLSIPLNGKL